MSTKVHVSVGSDEQDTSINFGRNEKDATIYSNDSTILTKLRKAGYKLPELDSIGGCEFTIPKNLISFRAMKKEKKNNSSNPKRVLSDEHKARLQAGREAKKAGTI